MSFTEKLRKLPNRREQEWFKFPNGYCAHVSKEKKYGDKTKPDTYMVLLMQYTNVKLNLPDFLDKIEDPTDVKYVVTTYTSEHQGIKVDFNRTFGADGLLEQEANDFIEQVKSLPKICEVPDTWND